MLDQEPPFAGNDEENQIPDTPAYTPEPFRLVVGLEYVIFSGDHMKVVYEFQNRFLGIIEPVESKTPIQIWYTADGFAERNFDICPNQDPFDVKRQHRDPDMMYLIRKDGSYTSNNCFKTYVAAAEAASERGGTIVPFMEVMDD